MSTRPRPSRAASGKEAFAIVAGSLFDDIVAGRKTKEWRDITPFWISRLYYNRPQTIRFQRGYSRIQARFAIKRITLANKAREEYPLGDFIPNGFKPIFFVIWIGKKLSQERKENQNDKCNRR